MRTISCGMKSKAKTTTLRYSTGITGSLGRSANLPSFVLGHHLSNDLCARRSLDRLSMSIAVRKFLSSSKGARDLWHNGYQTRKELSTNLSLHPLMPRRSHKPLRSLLVAIMQAPLTQHLDAIGKVRFTIRGARVSVLLVGQLDIDMVTLSAFASGG